VLKEADSEVDSAAEVAVVDAEVVADAVAEVAVAGAKMATRSGFR
jgi:hypothetical protein